MCNCGYVTIVSLHHIVCWSSNLYVWMHACVSQEALLCRSHTLPPADITHFLLRSPVHSLRSSAGNDSVSPRQDEADGHRLLCHLGTSLWLFASFFLVSPCLRPLCLSSSLNLRVLDPRVWTHSLLVYLTACLCVFLSDWPSVLVLS